MGNNLTPEQKAKKAAAAKAARAKAKAARLASGNATPAEAAAVGRIVASGDDHHRRVEAPKGARSVNVGRNHYKVDSNGYVVLPAALAAKLIARDGYRLVD